MAFDQQSILNSLRDKAPEAWSAYLRRFEDDPQLESGLSMQVIFHHVAPIAKDQESLEWGEIAVRAAELEARTFDPIVREFWQQHAMGLRAWFISEMGSRSDHSILNKDTILSWVTEELTLSVEEASKKATRIGKDLARVKDSSDPKLKQQVLDDLRQLRRIKHRLTVLKMLDDCGELAQSSALNGWLEIREQLP